LVVLCLAVPAGVALAQDKAAQEKSIMSQDPLSTWNKFAYARVKDILLKSAEKMPEENYSFKPIDTVRSFGQIVGHVADARYTFCSLALGESGTGHRAHENIQSGSDCCVEYGVRLL
jgi:uncharacterized damage-inducible protein DinB